MSGALASTPSLSDPEFWLGNDRDAEFARLRRDNPVSWQPEPPSVWSDGGRGYWALARHADVHTASRNTALFSSAMGTELIDLPVDIARAYSGMLNMDAPEHTRMRDILREEFTPRRVNMLRRRVTQAAAALIERVAQSRGCDFATEIADALPTTVTCQLLGVPAADRTYIAELSRASIPLGDPEFNARHTPLEAADLLIEYGKALIGERRERPTDDLTTVLAHAELDGQPLGDAAAGTFFELLITAGVETTGAAISHGLIALHDHPDQRLALKHADTSGYRMAVEEILRWSTPVIHFRRTALADTEIHGQPIQQGDKLVLFFNSANRDETVFARADGFDITRHPNPHVSFGAGGPHFCLGAHLARLEIATLFRELLQRLGPPELTEAPDYMRSMFFNGVKHLRCSFAPPD